MKQTLQQICEFFLSGKIGTNDFRLMVAGVLINEKWDTGDLRAFAEFIIEGEVP